VKRDLALIRELFFHIEKYPQKIDKNFDYEIKIKGYTKDQIDFHLNLMKDANFIDGIIHKSIINKTLSVYYDTLEIKWEGYEFFDSIKDKKIWKSFKSKFGNSDLPFTVIMEVCKTLITQIITAQIK